MSSEPATNDLGIAERIRRSSGRGGRVISATAKVTRDELRELEDAAKREGKALGEWARELLLHAARGPQLDLATFTELVALRMLTSTVLRTLALGQTFTAEAYAQILAEIKASKHETAKDVLTQYQNPEGAK